MFSGKPKTKVLTNPAVCVESMCLSFLVSNKQLRWTLAKGCTRVKYHATVRPAIGNFAMPCIIRVISLGARTVLKTGHICWELVLPFSVTHACDLSANYPILHVAAHFLQTHVRVRECVYTHAL